MPEKLVPFRQTSTLDSSAADLLRAIRTAYLEKSRALALALGPDFAAATLALALYYQASVRQVLLQHGPGLGPMHISENYGKAFLVALELIARHFPPAPIIGEQITITTSALQAVPPILELGLPIHALRDFAHRLGDDRVTARAEGNKLIFSDPHDLAAGAMVQAADEHHEMINQMPARDNVQRHIRAIAPNHLGRMEQLSSPPLAHLLSWYRRDFIKECYAGWKNYIAALAGSADYFMKTAQHTLPPIDDNLQIGVTTWAELRKFWFFHYALCQLHFTIALADFALKRKPRAGGYANLFMTLPGTFGEDAFKIHAGPMTDLVCFTTPATILDLAVRAGNVAPHAAELLLDQMVCRVRPGATISADNVFSGLLELAPSRLLLVPSLGMWTANSETMLSLVEKINSKVFDGAVGRAKAASATELAAPLLQYPQLRAIIDKIIKKPGGSHHVDIDLAVYDAAKNLLVCFEFKSTALQDVRRLTAFERTMQKALDQLAKIEIYLTETGGANFRRIFAIIDKTVAVPPIYKIIVTRRTYALGEYGGVPVLTNVALKKLIEQSAGDMAALTALVAKRDIRQQAETTNPSREAKFAIGDYSWSLPARAVGS